MVIGFFGKSPSTFERDQNASKRMFTEKEKKKKGFSCQTKRREN